MIIGLILISSNSEAKEKNTNYILFGGVSMNMNLHSSQFSQFEGMDNCCTEFSGGYGFGPQLSIGAIYLPSTKLFGKDWRFGLSLSYSDFSAKLTEEEFIGYVIYDDKYIDGISEFSLESDISTILISPFLTVFPMEDFPIGVNLGLEAGFYLNTEFSQAERLISPSGATFENYTRIRKEYSGDIPEVNSLFLSALLSVSYEAFAFDNFKLVPHLGLSYGLTDFTSAVNWKGNRLVAGVNLEYRIPAPRPPKPMPAPPPPLPKPEIQELLTVDITMEDLHNTAEKKHYYKNRESIQIPVSITKHIEMLAIKPEIFFSEKSANNTNKGLKNQFDQLYADAYSLISQALTLYMQDNPTEKIKITANYTKEKYLAENKANKLIKDLINSGVKENRISINYNNLSAKKFRYTELEEEANSLQIDFTSRTNVIYVPIDTTETYEIGTRSFHIQAKTNSENIENLSLKSSIGTIDKNGVLVLDSSIFTSLLNKRVISFTIEAEAVDFSQQTARDIKSFEIIKDFSIEEIIKTTTISQNQKTPIGFFAFDKSSFDVIDYQIVKQTQNAVKEGKKLILYAYTDNLGTTEYNKELAQRRAKTTIKLLNVNPSEVEIIYSETTPFSNDSPLGRMLNRSVFVEMK